MSIPDQTATVTAPTSAAVTVNTLCERLSALDRPDAGTLCDFARIFFQRVPRALLTERDLDALEALVVGAWEFARGTSADEVNVQVLNPEEEGWRAPVTVIRAELGDRPFIVDTIREYLAGEQIPIQQYVYPVFSFERDERGGITAIAEGRGGGLESMVHCEIPRIADAGRREEIGREVRRRLSDVVAVTDDFRSMLRALDETAAMIEEYRRRLPAREEEFAEILEFLRWLGRHHFVFLGYREYAIQGEGDRAELSVRPGSGLGILRDSETSAYRQPVRLGDLHEDLRARVVGGPVLIVSKANAHATVHRRARMDYVGIKTLDDAGDITGERRFLGLFTSQAYACDAADIPLLRGKFRRILQNSGARPGSHDYKEIVTILNAMPKEELFEASVEELAAEVDTVLASLFSEEVHVTVRPDPLRGEAGVMVILPRGKFSAEVRREVGEVLARRLGGTVRTYYLAMGAGDQARLHYYLSVPEGTTLPSAGELEREVATLVRSWEDRLDEELRGVVEPAEAHRLARQYGAALAAEYRAANSPAAAMHDVLHLEAMQRRGDTVALHLRQPLAGEPAPRDTSVLKLYLRDERLVLSDFMPLLEDARVRVVEVDTFAVGGGGLPGFMIYSFAVQTHEGAPIPGDVAPLLAEALLAVRSGDNAADAFNGLVLTAGLRWRQADVLRTYGGYAFQVGAIPSRVSLARALVSHPEVARLLVRLFHARLDPASREDADAVREAIAAALERVTSLADDRALRRIVNFIEATVRTNYFRRGAADPTARSGGVPYLSLKVRCADVEELKKTRLLYEIFVHSSRMEGVHLRGSTVSRGGIRWSDRPDDFRTEVMGLVQTQVVKNAVIVPGGSKGGFITKRHFAEREEMGREAAEQYRTLIRGMLDLTDNLANGRVVPPAEVVRHDGDDPYLVVAADKGTAHLSDVANGVAAEYGFWLGDAFASGGSNGYDHKREGITARGAWECVKRHFREMGKDVQKTPFTVAGIGDMSGDVFGNGMLLSRQTRLVAAFDHRHVFIDPDPDPATSYAERERMFALPRSSWDDYDRDRLSPGGMIVPRGTKHVVLTPEARRALGVEDQGPMDGESLIRAVLRAPVELLWNGGIGTYVKDPAETHADAGDTANDPVRVDATELRCQVIGEGGNLGLTQRARIRFCLEGGRINTDALDNSAGVDMSDHEVNIKILLNRVVGDGDLDDEGRNALLRRMSDRVSDLVLRNNVSQSLAVSLDQRRSREALDDFAAVIYALERDRLLNREREGIPDAEEVQERGQLGIGLTRPTLSVLLAHAKLYAKAHVLESAVPDDPATAAYMAAYFPEEAAEVAGPERLGRHPLRREIVTTQLVNDLVDLMGSSFLHRVARDSGASIPEVIRAWLVASGISGAAEIRHDLSRLEGEYECETIYRWLLGLARVLEATTHWLLANVPQEVAAEAAIGGARDGLAKLRAGFSRIVGGEDRALFLARLGELQDLGVERKLGERLITLRFLPQLMEILEVARSAGTDELRAAKGYYAVSDRFGTARLREAMRASVRDNAWDKRFAQALTGEVERAQRELVTAVLARAPNGEMKRALDAVERERDRAARAYRDLLTELRGEHVPLSAYALAVYQLQEVARGWDAGGPAAAPAAPDPHPAYAHAHRHRRPRHRGDPAHLRPADGRGAGGSPRPRRPGVPRLPRHLDGGARRLAPRRGRGAGGGEDPPRAADGGRDGEAGPRRRGRGGEVRLGLPSLRRARPAAARPPPGGDRRRAERGPLRSAGPRAGGDALELPLLAGLPLRRSRADGRQRGAAEARLQRPAVRARHRGGAPPRGFPRGYLPGAAGGGGGRRSDAGRPTRRRRHPHREHARGRGGRRARREADQEDGAGAGRQRPLRRDGRRRPGRGGGSRGAGTHPQQRPVVHRREAVHRPPGDRGRVPGPLRPGDGGAPRGRPDG
jgi:glutamate dehydrogenase